MEKVENIFISYFIRMFSSPSYVIAKHFFLLFTSFSFLSFLFIPFNAVLHNLSVQLLRLRFFPFFCFSRTLFCVCFFFVVIETNRQLVAEPWNCTTKLNCCLTAINKHFGKYYFKIKSKIKPFLLLK